MVSPVQFTNNPKVYFRGENEDLINSPGAFQQPEAAPETPADEVVLSTKPEAEKKGGIGKAIAKTIGGIVVLGGALLGLYKWKGVHGDWLNKEAASTGAKIKNALVKPGEWIDNALKSIGKKLGISGRTAEGAATGDAAASTGVAGAKVGEEAAAGAEVAGAKVGEEAAAGAEAAGAKVGTEAATGAEATVAKAGEEAATGAETAAAKGEEIISPVTEETTEAAAKGTGTLVKPETPEA